MNFGLIFAQSTNGALRQQPLSATSPSTVRGAETPTDIEHGSRPPGLHTFNFPHSQAR